MSHRFQRELHSFSLLLSQKELSLNLSSDYCDRYLQHLIHNRYYYLDIYAHVFETVLSNSHLDKENIFIIDYGAGNGLMGIFAKYCGFGKVIINEIDKAFLQAAQSLAEKLSIQIDQFIEGDITILQKERFELKPHAIIATDVIEHIYNLNDFFASLKSINPHIISVFTTGSNPKNYFKVKKLRALQLKDEFEGGSPDDFMLFGSEPHKAYFEIRKTIISELLRNEDDNLVNQLASKTRGLQKNEILTAIEAYQKTGILPNEPLDKFNTCNPETGSWTERVLTINQYKIVYQSNGFDLTVYSGFYNDHKKGLKKYIFQGLNFMVSIFGMRFAPFIILSGKPVKR
jgi:2-polyprenyl-3-methyl-5-hydroxy-6-metoxy-1,4-benzoquinol methylase